MVEYKGEVKCKAFCGLYSGTGFYTLLKGYGLSRLVMRHHSRMFKHTYKGRYI